MESTQPLELKLILCTIAKVPLTKSISRLNVDSKNDQTTNYSLFLSLKSRLFNQLWSLSTLVTFECMSIV